MAPGEIVTMKRILIVDDDYAVARSLASHVESYGFEVIAAHSLEQAEKVLKTAKTPFDLALLDIVLPIGPDSRGIEFAGFNLAERLRKLSPQTLLIALSAFMPPDRIEALSGAFDLCIQKSHLTSKQVAELIESFANRRKSKRHPAIFIVHGHDESTKRSLKNYLQNTLRL